MHERTATITKPPRGAETPRVISLVRVRNTKVIDLRHSISQGTVDTKDKPQEKLGLLERLDKLLEESSIEDYSAYLKDLQRKSPPGRPQDTEAVFIRALPHVFKFATAYADDKNMDWRVAAQIGNHALHAYVEERDPNEGRLHNNSVAERLRRAFREYLDNPFVAHESLPPLVFSTDPEQNKKDERDRDNIVAIKKAQMARKVLKEHSERDEISFLTQKTLQNWGVSESDILAGADQIIWEGQQAGDELALKYKETLRHFTLLLKKGGSASFDDTYELASEAFMKLIYEWKYTGSPFGAFVQSQLKNRMVDILKGEHPSLKLRSDLDRQTRNTFRYLEEHGLPVNDVNLNKALNATYSDMSVEQAMERYPEVSRVFTSLEEAMKIHGESQTFTLGDTLAVDGTTTIARKDLTVEDPTSQQAVNRLAELGPQSIFEILLSLRSLGDREKNVLIDLYINRKSQEEIGAEQDVSGNRICQLHTRALDTLRRVIYYNPHLRAVVEDAFAAI